MRSSVRAVAVVAAALLILAATLFAATPAAEAHTSHEYLWPCTSHYESTHRWKYNGPSGYDGGLQFLPSTWRAYTGRRAPAYAYQATRRFQMKVADRVAFTGFGKYKPQGLSAFAGARHCGHTKHWSRR